MVLLGEDDGLGSVERFVPCLLKFQRTNPGLMLHRTQQSHHPTLEVWSEEAAASPHKPCHGGLGR